MRELNTETEIKALPEKIWDILMDFDKYPEWNPFIKEIEGNMEVGHRLKALIAAPGGKAMTFKPKVLKVEPNREFRWLGHLLFPGVFDGEHIFQIEPTANGTVRFIHREKLGGLLVPMFWKKLDKDTRAGFNQMNEALKKRAES